MPVNTRPQHTDSSRANLADEPLLTFQTTTSSLRDSLNSLTSLDLSRSRIGAIAFEETGCLPAPFLLGPESRALLPCVQEKFECFDCHKAYYTFSGLAKHRQLQCEWQCRKNFNCKYCHKEYVSLGALKMHIRTHTLPCICKLCGKAFSRPWLLQGHIRTHTGEKPFCCPHCSRAFADRSNLRAHLQTHSDVKKYHCKSCAKTFSRMSLLSKHEEAGCPPLSPDTLPGLPGST
ncbi:SNAI2 protein, partial [Polyodon spathula]|nr:SNAI2 protein [Polyodon spathula]